MGMKKHRENLVEINGPLQRFILEVSQADSFSMSNAALDMGMSLQALSMAYDNHRGIRLNVIDKFMELHGVVAVPAPLYEAMKTLAQSVVRSMPDTKDPVLRRAMLVLSREAMNREIEAMDAGLLGDQAMDSAIQVSASSALHSSTLSMRAYVPAEAA